MIAGKKIATSLILVLFSVLVYSQAKDMANLMMEGKMDPRGKVLIKENNRVVDEIKSTWSGNVKITLEYNKEYQLEFHRKGCQTKLITVNTWNVPCEDTKFGFEFSGWKVKLDKPMDSTESILLVGTIKYDPEAGNFNYALN